MANTFSTATLGLQLNTSSFNSALRAAGLASTSAFASMERGAAQFKSAWDDATRGIKDTKRIISGILISQGFYTLMNGFGDAASEALTFAENMETAAVSLEYFMEGTDKAAQSLAYLREMNEFAARTPFSTEAALELSKYIQAVGIGTQYTKSFLQVVTDAAAATGATEENLQRVVFALGQMKTKGRIANEEIRQLANANIPIYEILQEELNLTGKQISKIGKYWVDADKAIVAILNGLEKRYAGAADKIADTVTGMLDTIADDSKIIAQQAGDGIYGALSDVLTKIRDKLDEYRDISTEMGSVGLFNQILVDIDPTGEVGTKILTLIGNARELGSAIMDLYNQSKPLINLFGQGLYAGISTATVAATALTTVITDLEKALDKLGITSGWLGHSIGELYVIYKAGKWAFTLGQGALYAGQSILQLGGSVLTSLVPAFAGGTASTMGFTASLLTLAGAAVLVYAALKNMNSFAGLDVTTGDLFPTDYESQVNQYLAEMQEYNDKIAQYQEQFNTPYDEMSEGASTAIDDLEDVTDASKKAAKSVKHDWVAAFDEVYQVPSWNDTSSGTSAKLPELPDLGALLPTITFSFPGIDEDLEKPEFDWDEIYNNSVLNQTTLNPDVLANILPAAIALGVLAGAARFVKPVGPSDINPGGGAGTKVENNAFNKAIDNSKILKQYVALDNARIDVEKKILAQIQECKALLADKDNPAFGANGRPTYALEGKYAELQLMLKQQTTLMEEQLKLGERIGKPVESIKGYQQAMLEARHLDTVMLLEELKRCELILSDPRAVELEKIGAANKAEELLKKLPIDVRSTGGAAALYTTGDYIKELDTVAARIVERFDALNSSNMTVAKFSNDNYQTLKGIGEDIGELLYVGDKLTQYGVALGEQTTQGQRLYIEFSNQRKELKEFQKSIKTDFAVLNERANIVAQRTGEALKAEKAVDRATNSYVADMVTYYDGLSKRVNELSDKAYDKELNDNRIAADKKRAAEQEAAFKRQEQINNKNAQAQAAAARVNGAPANASGYVSAEQLSRSADSLFDRLSDISRTGEALEQGFDAANAKADYIEAQLQALVDGGEDSVKASELDSWFKDLLSEVRKYQSLSGQSSLTAGMHELINTAGDIGVLNSKQLDALHAMEVTAVKDFNLIAELDTVVKNMLPKYPGLKGTAGTAADKLARPAMLEALFSGLSMSPAYINNGTMAASSFGLGSFEGSLVDIFSKAFGRFDEAIAALSPRSPNFETQLYAELGKYLQAYGNIVASQQWQALGADKFYGGGYAPINDAIVQIDSVVAGVAGDVHAIPSIITSMSADNIAALMTNASITSAGLDKASRTISADLLKAINPEVFTQLAYSLYGDRTHGALTVLNRNADLADIDTLAMQRFSRAYNTNTGILPSSGQIFSADNITAWAKQIPSLSGAAAEQVVQEYMRNVVLPTFNLTSETLDRLEQMYRTGNATGIKDAIGAFKDFRWDTLSQMYSTFDVGFSPAAIKSVDAGANAKAVLQMNELVAMVLGDENLPALLHTYIRFTDKAGQLAGQVAAINANSHWRQIGKMTGSVRTWLDNILKIETSLEGTIGPKLTSAIDSKLAKFTYDIANAKTAEIREAVVNAFAADMHDVAARAIAHTQSLGDALFAGTSSSAHDMNLIADALNTIADNAVELDNLPRLVRNIQDSVSKLNALSIANAKLAPTVVSDLRSLTANIEAFYAAVRVTANEATNAYIEQFETIRTEAEQLINENANATYRSLFTSLQSPFEILNADTAKKYLADELNNAYKRGVIKLAEGFSEIDFTNAIKELTSGGPTVPNATLASGEVAPVQPKYVIDLETAGLIGSSKAGKLYPEIMQVSVLEIETGRVQDFLVNRGVVDNARLLNYMRSIEGGVGAEWQNISIEDLNRGYTVDELRSILHDLIGNQPVTGYNATNTLHVGGAFDTRVLSNVLGVHVDPVYDVMEKVQDTFAQYTGTRPMFKLTDIAEIIAGGKIATGAHNAANDILLTQFVNQNIDNGRLATIIQSAIEQGIARGKLAETLMATSQQLNAQGITPNTYVGTMRTPVKFDIELPDDVVDAAAQFNDGAIKFHTIIDDLGYEVQTLIPNVSGNIIQDVDKLINDMWANSYTQTLVNGLLDGTISAGSTFTAMPMPEEFLKQMRNTFLPGYEDIKVQLEISDAVNEFLGTATLGYTPRAPQLMLPEVSQYTRDYTNWWEATLRANEAAAGSAADAINDAFKIGAENAAARAAAGGPHGYRLLGEMLSGAADNIGEAAEDAAKKGTSSWQAFKENFTTFWQRMRNPINDYADAAAAGRAASTHLNPQAIDDAFAMLLDADKAYMSAPRAAWNYAQSQVAFGYANWNTDWVKEAQKAYEEALKQYSEVSKKFFKTVSEQLVGGLADFKNTDDIITSLSKLNKSAEYMAMIFDPKTGAPRLIGDALRVSGDMIEDALQSYTVLFLKQHGDITGELSEAINGLKAAMSGGSLDGLTEEAQKVYKAFKELRAAKDVGDIEGLSKAAKHLNDAFADFGSRTIISDIDAFGDAGDATNDVLKRFIDIKFAGKEAADAVEAAADTVGTSFKTLLNRAVEGVANFGLIDVAVAGLQAAFQAYNDTLQAQNLQLVMELTDQSGLIKKIAEGGFNVGESVGKGVYSGVWEEFGFGIVEGVTSSLAFTAAEAIMGSVTATAGAKLGGTVGTALGGPLGTAIGAGVGVLVGAAVGWLTDTVIEAMGGHTATNLYTGDYNKAIADGWLLTVDQLNAVAEALGMTYDEIMAEGPNGEKSIARQVDEQARAPLISQIYGTADKDNWLEANDIRDTLYGNAATTDTALALRMAAAMGKIDPSLFRKTATVIEQIHDYTESKNVSIVSDSIGEDQLRVLEEILGLQSGQLSFKDVQYTEYLPGGEQAGTYSGRAIVNGTNGSYLNVDMSNLAPLNDLLTLMFTQGNTASAYATTVSDLLSEYPELQKLVNEQYGAYVVAYDNLGNFITKFNAIAGTDYIAASLSDNFNLGQYVMEWAAKLIDTATETYRAQAMLAADNVSLFDVIGANAGKLATGEGLTGTAQSTVAGLTLEGLSGPLYNALAELGLNFTEGKATLNTQLSGEQELSYVTLHEDFAQLYENLKGWRIDMSNIDLDTLSITAKDTEILASAGIQINSDGTITFMKAEQADQTGAERGMELSADYFSEAVLQKLANSSFTMNFEAGSFDFDPVQLADNIWGATFKLPDNFGTNVEPAVKEALDQIGDFMDSGYFTLTDKSFLSGEKTIAAYLDGLVDENGNKLASDRVYKAVSNIDALIQQEGNSAIENIAEWADQVVVPSPIPEEWLSADLIAAFAAAGIHFVEYGEEFLMVMNNTGEHIRDGCVLVDAEYWSGLGEPVVQALEELGVKVTPVGNQVMVALNDTLETGVGNIVSLFVNRPDLWDQMPEALKENFSHLVSETDNGMLEVKTTGETHLVKIGEDWVASWKTVGDATLKTVDENGNAIDKSLQDLSVDIDHDVMQIVGVIEEKDIPGLAQNEFAIPFEELPDDIKASLAGPGGLYEGMESGLVQVRGLAEDEFAAIVGAAVGASNDVGDAATDMVAAITEAVTNANRELQRLETMKSQAGKSGIFWLNNNQISDIGKKGSDGNEYHEEYNSSGQVVAWQYYDSTTGTVKRVTKKPAGLATGGIADGLTLTGEKGRELAILPDGSTRMLGADGKGQLLDLPAGTRVLNNKDTEDILKYTGPISSVPKLADGNATVTMETPYDLLDDQTKKYLKEYLAYQVDTADAEEQVQVDAQRNYTTDLVETSTKRISDSNAQALRSNADKLLESFNERTLLSTQALQDSIAAISADLDASDAATLQFFTDLYSDWVALYSAYVDLQHADFETVIEWLDVIKQSIDEGVDAIVKAIKQMARSSSSSSSTYGSSYSGYSGLSDYSGSYVVVGDNIDYHQAALDAAAKGDWDTAMQYYNLRGEKVNALGTDYGNSQADVYAQMTTAFNDWILGHSDFSANVAGYLSVGNVDAALKEFDLRGYKIDLTGNDYGNSQADLWQHSGLSGWTGISYDDWLSLHGSNGYSKLNSYDEQAVYDMFDRNAVVITDEMNENARKAADTLLNGETINNDELMRLCEDLNATGIDYISQDIMDSISSNEKGFMTVTEAINALNLPLSNIQAVANVGLQGIYDANNWHYKTSDATGYTGETTINVKSVDLSTDYSAKMAEAAAAGNWSAFDQAAASREAKVAITGLNGYESTESLKWAYEDMYKRNGSANGSLITSEGLYYAGENDAVETIIPLEQPDVLSKVGEAIGQYVPTAFIDYSDRISDAATTISEDNAVAIRGAVAALLEGQSSDSDELYAYWEGYKEEVLAAIASAASTIEKAVGSLSSAITAAQSAAASTASTRTSTSSGGYSGGYSAPKIYTPTASTPVVSYDSNTDYSAKMAEAAATGNWTAFDTYAVQRDAKMAADPSLSKWQNTEAIKEALEKEYKRNGSANGSLIDEEGLYYAGEENKQEAIIPLEQPDVLSKVGEAIGQYVPSAFIDYRERIDEAADTISEDNAVAIRGAVAALLEGQTNSNDDLYTHLEALKDEIVAAIQAAATSIAGSLSTAITQLQSSMASAASSSSSSSTGTRTGGYSSGSGYTVTTHKPTASTPVISFDSNVDYNAKMAEAAAAGNWTAFDTYAVQRDAKMAADPSLSKWQNTEAIKEALENEYKRNGSANGSLIDEEGLYYAGEQGKQEAIIPLEQPDVLDKVGNAIGQYIPMVQIDYRDRIDEAADVISEDNAVAIRGAVAALLEGQANDQDTLQTFITSQTELIISAINGAASTISGSLSSAISSMQSAMAASSASSGSTSAGSSSYSGGSGYTVTTHKPTASTPVISFDSNTDYSAKMAEAAAAGNWNAFDTYATQRNAKMASDPSLSVWAPTDEWREKLEEQYGRGSARGSLITAPGLYLAGEDYLNEAIIPLEQPSVLSKVGASIASFMPVQMQEQMGAAQGISNAGVTASSFTPATTTMDAESMVSSVTQHVLEAVLPQMAYMQADDNSESKRPLYVGTLIADDRSLRTLERKLYDIRQTEASRR